MQKLSFFKLPFIFVVLLTISKLLVTMVGFIVIFWDVLDNYSYLWSIGRDYIVFQLFYLIPDCLLFFVVASIALYRINIHIITLKNIGLLVINIFFINVLGFLLDKCQQIAYVYILDDIINPVLKSFIFIQIIVVFTLLYFSLASLLTYYYIKLFGDWFDKSKQAFELTQHNSPKIHFILFLAFFFFLFIMFASFLKRLNIQLNEQNFHFSYWSNLLLPLIIYLINFLMVVLLTKNLFKRTFVVLQSDRIIKSATVINVLILLINIILWVIKFNTYYFISWFDNIDTVFMLLSPTFTFLLSLVLSCLIIRYVTKYYFANPPRG